MPTDVKLARSKDPAAIVLGYLNFSSGAFDAAAWRACSDLYATFEHADAAGVVGEAADAATRLAALLAGRLAELEPAEPAFRDATQARWVLETLCEHVLPGYRRFHADLLEHQPPGGIERPFFVMAAAQAVLATGGGAGDDPAAAVMRAVDVLNDYVGWRPVAVLENGRLSQPYAHERVRPVPLYAAGAGVAHGRYGGLVSGAIDILRDAPADLLHQADFDLDLLEELAIDPRAFDFLHPAASRPNYLFGLWDPGRIDEQGNYRRMVVQQATLDGILSWPLAAGSQPAAAPPAELRWEASAVLAGVLLMASGLSGHGPGARQAGLPLAELLPRIAGYRDGFYRWLLDRLPDGHRDRLEEEARRMRQPFGGVRRHINSVLAGRRARQVESVALAAVLARLGRSAAAERMAAAVPAASARMLARITGRVVSGQQSLRRAGDAAGALDDFDAAADLLLRAVGCGAAVDPWNILGLSGQFPLHEPGGESLPDPRVEDLVNATGALVDGYAAAWRQAALAGSRQVAARASAALERLAVWWDRFATTTVTGVPHLSGREAFDAAREVIDSLSRRRESGSAAPPPGFWRREVAAFSSPRTHAEAADALLREDDLDGATGLLVHWASLLDGEALERSGPIWLAAASRWMALASADTSPVGRGRVRRFLELVEANTSGVVDLIETVAVGREPGDRRGRTDDDPADEAADQPDSEESVAAAYESMVWRDSADDGVDGGMIDVDVPGGSAAGGLAAVESAAEFLIGVCGLLRQAVANWCRLDVAAATSPNRAELDSIVGWRHSLRRLRRSLVRAAVIVAGRDSEPSPGMPPAEYDRLRWARDGAAERLIEAAVQAAETSWLLSARLHLRSPTPRPGRDPQSAAVGCLFAALLAGDAAGATRHLAAVEARLQGRPVLYVPLSRGGRPDRIIRARTRERLLERLAACLPRLGLVAETAGVVQLAKQLESLRPRGAASVSEFDRVFEAATMALVERIVVSATAADSPPDGEAATERILAGLALLVPRLLETWMTHARQLRLSVLERVRDDKAFATIREFIEHYGSGLFTQHVLAPGSLRGILRGGVGHYLEQLAEQVGEEPEGNDPRPRRPVRLLEDLASGALPAKQAAARLRLVLESIAENHAEYRDWNSTTTQSDRGECLHILLEFLRVKAEHDRIAWTLRPVNIVHRMLARRGATAAAAAWRGRMREETRDTAATLVQRLTDLEAHWSLRLASVADRVRRPFTAVLEQDELVALVESAVAELFTGKPAGAGADLEAKAEAFVGLASGSGVEVPDWLEQLGAAVDRAIGTAEAGGGLAGGEPDRGRLPEALPWLPLPWDSLQAALAGNRPGRT